MNENVEEKQNKDIKEKPMNFFTKLWNSITKIEKYPDMAALGVPKAITYIAKLIVIWAIVICLGVMYQVSQMLAEGTRYLENEFPEFYYKDGIIDVQSEVPIYISENNSILGQTIIDTKTDDDQTINKYIRELEQTGSGVIVLKDKLIMKNGSVAGTINYNYKQILDNVEITEFNKQDVIDYVNSPRISSLYFSIFITVFIYAFVIYLITTLANGLFLSVFGYLTTWIAKIRMRYAAIFNMSVYALTLSTILNMIYLAINIFIEFNMEYFQVMYVTVAAIYLVAAIFLLKAEFIKKQLELMKIAEEQAIVKKEIEEQEEENERKKQEEKKKRKQKDKEDEEKNKAEKDDNNDDAGKEPEGSNA